MTGPDFRKLMNRARRSKVFSAVYDGGLCSVCDDVILTGDQVLFVDDQITHWECDDDED